MKTVTFFNEKGGTGKTTLTALFASWLAYEKKEPVYVMDFDFPSYQMYAMRSGELEYIKQNPDSLLAKAAGQNIPYTIGKAQGRNFYSETELKTISSRLKNIVDKNDGYFLFDFPGRYLPNDPVHYLSKQGQIGLVVFPIDSDRQSRAAALNTYVDMQRFSGGRQKCVILWNKESAGERKRSATKDWYSEPNRIFEKIGIPVIDQRIHDILIARRDSTTFGFIRSTLCWPKANIRKACPYIEEIFTQIKAMLDNK